MDPLQALKERISDSLMDILAILARSGKRNISGITLICRDPLNDEDSFVIGNDSYEEVARFLNKQWPEKP